MKRRGAIAAVAAGLVVATGLAAAVSEVAKSVEDLKADAVEFQKERDAMIAQAESAGLTPVVTPDSEPAAEPDQLGENGVRAIVAEELAQRKLQLTVAQIDQIARVAASRVPPGKDGQPPSDAEVRAVVQDVVAAVCADDACRGAPGTPGADAPPVTDAQLAARVAAYCAANDGCRGPKGDNGDDGKDGAPGRGIRAGPDFVLNDAGECVARTTYTDDTVHESPPVNPAVCVPPADNDRSLLGLS